jgi:hypothetical protein
MSHSPRTPLARAGAVITALAVFLVWPAPAAELLLEFARMPQGAPPAEFQSALTGGGPPPEWKIIQAEVPSAFPPLSEGAPEMTHETVLAQLSQDATDERFPLLIYEREEFADFTARLRFRTVAGRVEQMAGMAFRLQDPTNYYVVRASSLGNSFRFYKFVDGVRSPPIGPELPIPSGVWHTLEVSCRGNSIRCRLNDHEAIPALTDTSFTQGRLALWTKSDSISHFASLQIDYDPVQTLPERLVIEGLQRYPRLKAITLFARSNGGVQAVASSDPGQLGTAARTAEIRALESGQISAGTARDHSAAVFPLRDRNGEPVFAVLLRMRTFRGQTDSNVAARGKIIADYLQELVLSAEFPGAGSDGRGVRLRGRQK